MPSSPVDPASPGPPLSVSDCYRVLGLEVGAEEKDVRRAYLQKARETHPDKGGSADEFRLIVAALDRLTNPENLDAAASEQRSSQESELAPKPSYQKFSSADVSDLAEQIRRLNSEKVRAQKQACSQRKAEIEERKRRSQLAAATSKEEEAAARLKQALRTQRRASMPEGVEFEIVRSGSMLCERFCAKFEDSAGTRLSGPNRKTIDLAEADTKRLIRAAKHRGDAGALKVLGILQKEVAKQGWK